MKHNGDANAARSASEPANQRDQARNEDLDGNALDIAVGEEIAETAKRIADQIAANSRLRFETAFGNSPLFDAAVKDALTGPAQELADQIAASSRLRFETAFGNSPLFDAAVKDALTGPAQELAQQIKASSLEWLRSYSRQELEPAFYAGVARTIAEDELDAQESDYQPLSPEARSIEGRASPASIFVRHEVTVKSLQGLTQELDRLTQRIAPLTVAWRGQANADWTLHSTLYRTVRAWGEAKLPGEPGAHSLVGDRLPTEDHLVAAERYLLTEIANRWRVSHIPAIELLSKMQHRGIPTRLLDATRSPLIALWFAINEQPTSDARLFAIAHRPIQPRTGGTTERLDRAFWSATTPFWFDLDAPSRRVVWAWGTGTRLREVLPPEYDKRILAQKAVFLLDGTPAVTGSMLESFNRISDGDWSAGDITAAMSVVLAPGDPSRAVRDDSSPLSLVYSFRIPAKLKEPIGQSLRRTFGLDWETVYPDMEGIKAHLASFPDWLSQACLAHPLSPGQTASS